MLSQSGIKKVANLRAEEARLESRREMKLVVFGILFVLFVVGPITIAVSVYLLS